MKKRTFFGTFFLGIFLLQNTAWAIEIKINDTREENFYIDVLKMILDKSGEEYSLLIENNDFSQARNIISLKEGETDVLYAGTSRELEEQLLPLLFPIMRGLISRRIFIINKNKQDLFDSVKSLDDLRLFEGIQGIGWSDIEILEAAGLHQHKVKYNNIFKMINEGRPYYFSRGVTEAFGEISVRKETMQNLTVENNLLLSYPYAIFFFVNRSNTELADILESGFLKAYQDGSYVQFFYNHPTIKNALDQADMGNRIKIEIPNPTLSPETAAIPEKYWHQD